MGWDDIRTLASDPLVTIGAHSKSHVALAKVADYKVRSEISDSVARIEHEIGKPCRHFSYPYGSEDSAGEREFAIAKELGLLTAVTTRKGLLHATHGDQLTALPRLSLNGDFQDPRYVKVLLSGAPFAFLKALQKMSAPLRQTMSLT
jgi:peptidoglycan/xylan/chitin deacetylase (PgdA/CDA1 family)